METDTARLLQSRLTDKYLTIGYGDLYTRVRDNSDTKYICINSDTVIASIPTGFHLVATNQTQTNIDDKPQYTIIHNALVSSPDSPTKTNNAHYPEHALSGTTSMESYTEENNDDYWHRVERKNAINVVLYRNRDNQNSQKTVKTTGSVTKNYYTTPTTDDNNP